MIALIPYPDFFHVSIFLVRVALCLSSLRIRVHYSWHMAQMVRLLTTSEATICLSALSIDAARRLIQQPALLTVRPVPFTSIRPTRIPIKTNKAFIDAGMLRDSHPSTTSEPRLVAWTLAPLRAHLSTPWPFFLSCFVSCLRKTDTFCTPNLNSLRVASPTDPCDHPLECDPEGKPSHSP